MILWVDEGSSTDYWSYILTTAIEDPTFRRHPVRLLAAVGPRPGVDPLPQSAMRSSWRATGREAPRLDLSQITCRQRPARSRVLGRDVTQSIVSDTRYEFLVPLRPSQQAAGASPPPRRTRRRCSARQLAIAK